MKHFLKFAVAFSLIAAPAAARAPSYDSAAPIAYMVDLSSGRVLYARDADRRMPPASMAKMMTVYVAFKLIKEGRLKLDQTFNVRPETWRKWHGTEAGSLMFLEVNSNVSVDNLLKGIVTLSGNDACVVLAEGVAGDRGKLHRSHECRGQAARPHQQPFRDFERLAGQWRDLCHRARPGEARCRDDPGLPRSLQDLLFAPELHLGQADRQWRGDHAGQPRSAARQDRRG